MLSKALFEKLKVKYQTPSILAEEFVKVYYNIDTLDDLLPSKQAEFAVKVHSITSVFKFSNTDDWYDQAIAVLTSFDAGTN